MLINTTKKIINKHELPIVILNTKREVEIVNRYSKNHMWNPNISPFVK